MRQKKQRHFIVEAALKRAMKMLEIKIRNGPVFSVYLLFYDRFLSLFLSISCHRKRKKKLQQFSRYCRNAFVLYTTCSYLSRNEF